MRPNTKVAIEAVISEYKQQLSLHEKAKAEGQVKMAALQATIDELNVAIRDFEADVAEDQ